MTRPRVSRWFVYTVRCRDGSLYTGITTDLARRIKTHNTGQGGAYTRSRKPVRLVFRELQPTRSSALKREAQIKRWSREEKIQKLLISFRRQRPGGCLIP